MRIHLFSLRASSTLACGLLSLGGGLCALPAPAVAASYYVQQNLVTNFPNKYTTNPVDGRGTVGDGAVVNAWGLAVPPANAGGAWWIANNGTGTVSIYSGDTTASPLGQGPLKIVPVAPPADDPNATATPTGQAWNSSADFPCTGTSSTGAGLSGPSRFLVSTEDGNLQCWTATTSGFLKSFSIAVTGDAGSIYKGLAVTTQVTARVSPRLTRSPISARREVKMARGTSAKGMPKLSTIWENTSAWVALSPRPSTTSDGIMVSARRRNSGIRQPMKPAITT